MKHLILCCLAALLLCSFTHANEARKPYQIVPLPNHIKTLDAAPFVLSATTQITYPKGNEQLKQTATLLSEYLSITLGIKLSVVDKTVARNAIVLTTGYQHTSAEAYQLSISDKHVLINGASAAGTFYGVQTLRKEIAEHTQAPQIQLSAVEITDSPRFAYRGAMLDASRHFASVAFVKKYIDILALHNINTFHWHLTDDQGWRIEIKKYPKLTEIGSTRTETVIGKNTGKYDGKPHGGFYTQEQIKEIVRYAQQRFITVIPEIDLPGHMLAALTAYPELGCTGGPYNVWGRWGVSDDVLCVGNEQVFTFIEDVFTELFPLFPSTYYHLGGDECPKKRWEQCPKCQAKINELGLTKDAHHSAEERLQSYCISRVQAFLKAKGKKSIGWDEILEGGLPADATVMSWRGFEGGIQAAQQGNDVIMTPGSHMYFDHYQSEDAHLEPLAIGGYVSLEKVYSFEPVPDVLTPDQRKHILGAQANLWREYIATDAHVEYMLLPRLAALSEVLWTQASKKDYRHFLKRLSSFLPVYDKLNYNYGRQVLDVTAHYQLDTQLSAIKVSLHAADDSPIYYTLDGSQPTPAARKYTNDIVINSPLTLKAMVFRDNQKSSRVFERTFQFNKASMKPPKFEHAPAPKYTFDGAITLVDGKRGSKIFASGEWLGFYNTNFEATIDLKEVQSVQEVTLGSYTGAEDWIFGPCKYQVFVSTNGTHFEEVYTQEVDMPKQGDESTITNLKARFAPCDARYVRVLATIHDQIPAWHAGAGKPTFMFVDEIIVD
ncbi:MAG: hypothetical protein RL662_694 [Bacteroidota bacterium]|jgi:hexosaminidase